MVKKKKTKQKKKEFFKLKHPFLMREWMFDYYFLFFRQKRRNEKVLKFKGKKT